MKVTIDGITYEGSIDEIREIVRNPPTRSSNDWDEPVKYPNDVGEPWWTQPIMRLGPDLTCIGGTPNTVCW